MRRPLRVALLLALAVGLPLGAATKENGLTRKQGRFDDDFEELLRSLAKAYDSRDVDAIAAFYANRAYSRFLTFAPRTADGRETNVAAAREMLQTVNVFEVRVTERARIWKKGTRVFTLVPFELTYEPCDGPPIHWKGRHSAIWQKNSDAVRSTEGEPAAKAAATADDDRWVIVQERLLERDTTANPFELHLPDGRSRPSTVAQPSVAEAPVTTDRRGE